MNRERKERLTVMEIKISCIMKELACIRNEEEAEYIKMPHDIQKSSGRA